MFGDDFLLLDADEREERILETMRNKGYPCEWEEYVGQERAVEAVKMIANVDSIPHIAMTTPVPGVGKTALALLLARKTGRVPVYLNASEVHPSSLHTIIEVIEGDLIIIWDEFHRMFATPAKAKKNEWLLSLLQDGEIPGYAPFDKKVTVVAVTTDASMVPAAIMSRLALRPTFTAYSDDEAMLIASNYMESLGMEPATDSQLMEIVTAGNNNPRKIKLIVGWLKTMGGDEYDVQRALWFMGYTSDGLADIEVLYLVTLYRDFSGKAGEAAMKAKLGVQSVAQAEQSLTHLGYIIRTASGRTLTPLGEARASQLAKD